jgi:predicted RNA polymerase sigma factor
LTDKIGERRANALRVAATAANRLSEEKFCQNVEMRCGGASSSWKRSTMVTAYIVIEPEAHGLLALMVHCEARRAARYTSDGKFAPLDQQDAALWSQSMIDEAEAHLRSAAAFKDMGRYQLEAAIQSIHADRAKTGRIDWKEIACSTRA